MFTLSKVAAFKYKNQILYPCYIECLLKFWANSVVERFRGNAQANLFLIRLNIQFVNSKRNGASEIQSKYCADVDIWTGHRLLHQYL